MVLFELVIALLFAGGIFALWADRLDVPYPALLALVGVGLAFVPGVPDIQLDPELALALFVAPTLLDAAYDASPRDLRRHLASVVNLAVVLVLLTVAAVAWSLRLVVPDVGWAAAIALGAIVAPPDASAAAAVLHKLRPPHRLLVILEGESLFNDATALLIYRVAVAAAVTGTFAGWKLIPMLLVTSLGGAVLGWAGARLHVVMSSRLHDISISIIFQFIGTFAVWIVADRLGLSAIITVVVFAMTLARRVAGRMNARHRIASYAVWEVVVLVLNVLAFVLIGLQLRSVLARVKDADLTTYAVAAAIVCVTVILVRVVWTMLFARVVRWRGQRRRPPVADKDLPTAGTGLLASWCGMRGIVTLATALALPGDNAFPHRDLVVFCAFAVVLCTLVVQGLTLKPLMRLLRLRDDGTVEEEIHIARLETVRAALRALERNSSPGDTGQILQQEYASRLAMEEQQGQTQRESDSATLIDLQKQAVCAQRQALTKLRAGNIIGDSAFHAVEEEIDLLDLTAETRVAPNDGD